MNFNSEKNMSNSEVHKFSAFSHSWWDPSGPVQTLHQINPLRTNYILSHTPDIKNKKILDIGCGGGLLTEALAKKEAEVTGIDANAELIQIAKLHSIESGLSIDYHKILVEEFAQNHQGQFDIVTCMELLEHVPQPELVVHSASHLVKSGGFVFFSTLNRNLKSWLMAIIGAEYLLRLIPKGTHHYEKMIKPSELHRMGIENDLKLIDQKGISYLPLSRSFDFTPDLSVNYLVCFQKI